MFINKQRVESSRTHLVNLAICQAICLGLAITSQAALGQESTPDPLATRLAILEKRIEEERRKHHIPGVAIAVVKGDKVVLSRGFGYSDLKKKKAVTPETLFAIGSSTKAITAVLIGMLADDSRMSWDDPVEKHIPGFRLKVDTGDERVTIRDLLCHRTGYTRMSILWASGRLTQEEVLKLAGTAEPYAGFRKRFQYNNIMYMAAGLAAGQAADGDWESLVAARILKPLKMTDSTTSIAEAQKDERLAKGYLWMKDREKHKRLPMRDLDLIGPAGSINSNVKDMAQWVRFQLGRGVYQGKRLLAAETHAETWKQQIEIAPGRGYGLGWMLEEWNGKQVVQHGGNIDGFSAQVALLPEHDLGFVLLANLSTTPLQSQSIDLVFTALVGDVTRDSENVKRKEVAPLLGKYVANFGMWRDERFTVLIKNGRLAIDVPGQRAFELKAPDSKGKWYFALTNQIAVSFRNDDGGKSVSLTMYQSGFEFECPREGVEYKPEVPLKELQPLVGAYRDEKRKVTIKVIIQNNRLAISMPGGESLELSSPDDEGKWALRANKTVMQVRFNKANDGSIRSMTRLRKGKELQMPRVAVDSQEAIPTVEELLEQIRAGYGADKVAGLGNVRMTGTVDFVHQGGRGKAMLLIAGLDRYLSALDLGSLGHVKTAYDGKRGWVDTAFSPFEKLSGPRLKQLRFNHPLWLLNDWQKTYDSAAIVRSGSVDGEKVFLLKLSGKELPSRILYVSAKSGLVLREKTAQIVPGLGQIPVTVNFSDYRTVNGVKLPFKIVEKGPESGETLTQYETATTPDKLSKRAFRLTPK